MRRRRRKATRSVAKRFAVELLIVVGLLWVLPIYVAWQIGQAKHRAGFLWGLFLGWLGVIVVALLPPVKPWDPGAGIWPPQGKGGTRVLVAGDRPVDDPVRAGPEHSGLDQPDQVA